MFTVQFHHLCIQTECYHQSLDFYCRVLGATLIKETPDFHTRKFNTWLKLGDFFIELQTAKAHQPLKQADKHTNGLAHFCLLAPDIITVIQHIKSCDYHQFQAKNDQVIYQVEGSLLSKVVAPEGTIIEIRDSHIS